MKPTLPEPLLARLSDFVAARTALHYPPERWGDLESRAGAAAREFGFSDTAAFIEWLAGAALPPERLEILVSHLTIGETYFWREPQVFEALERTILPELIHLRAKDDRRLKLWSAGCATGEEPYSLAIALRRALPAGEGWRVSILATDINPRILRRAQAGLYGPWSFRNAPPWLKRDHFRPAGEGRFEILPEVRAMVTFAYLNLAEDVYPSPLNDTQALDIIFCRNVLMYFSPERARRAAENFHRALVAGGWLLVSACELSPQVFPSFAAVHFPGAAGYRKPAPDPWPARVGGVAPVPGPPGAEGPPWAPPPEAPPSPPPRPRQPARPAGGRRGLGREALPPSGATSGEGPLAPAKALPRPGAASGKGSVAPPAVAIRALADQGRLAEALARCQEALAADRLAAELHLLQAAILQEQERVAEAAASLKRALYLDPDLVTAHFALGRLLLRQGRKGRAGRCFANALALLEARREEEVLPEAEGLTAGRLKEIIRATLRAGAAT